MPETRLRDTLEELHDALEEPGAVDEESRALLSDILRDIQTLLERSPEEREEKEGPPLLDRLAEVKGSFEESHPSLTAAINRVANALSNLGI